MFYSEKIFIWQLLSASLNVAYRTEPSGSREYLAVLESSEMYSKSGFP